MVGLCIKSSTSCACKLSMKTLRWPLVAFRRWWASNNPCKESSGKQSNSRLPCCCLHNCCISESLRCHLSKRGDPPVGWDEKMWEGYQTCLRQGSESKPDKLDIWSSFLTFFLHILRVCRYTAYKMSEDMAVSWDLWLFLNTMDTRLPSWGF